MSEFKFKPLQKVKIPMLDCWGRVTRCVLYAGPCATYSVDYAINGDIKNREFFEDEIE